MPVPHVLKDRYELREPLGQGGMGVVYRAYDTVVKRDVALKTLRDAPNRAALQMFFKECEVLAALSHPNIVEIFDMGEFDDEGHAKPYFVMPLLPGAPLDLLIRTASHRLTVERVIDILCQTCRGLHAAHERGLVHRDMKPSNIFVLDDDSVKIIDFGVAHLVEQGLSVGVKGTLLYMAPEQFQMKPASPASDIFSLAVVAYEALTRRRPFEGGKDSEIGEAILHVIPPPVSELNPAVNQAVSRAIHKGMAKQSWSRYASAREFAETLQKALRNEPIEFFSAARIQPRIERATKSFESGDLQFAGEIVGELEAEGHLDPAMTTLRRQIELAGRTRTIGQLLESARMRFELEEYTLALHKLQDILQLEPANAQALGLKASIENKLTAQKLEDWRRLARQHLENQAFGHAREAVRNVLQLRPGDTPAAQLMAEIDRREQEFLSARKEKQELYHLALEAWNAGEVSVALGKLERVLDLDRRSPDTSAPERAESYQQLYNKVRSEHDSLKNSYSEARTHLADRNFSQALAIAGEWLAKYPGHALFQALKFDIEEQQRQDHSARIAAVDREMEAEPDLDRRVSILEKALQEYPGERHLDSQLKPLRDKRDLVNAIAAKARYHEERGQFADALGQWEILKTIYGQYPGLAFEIERVVKRRDHQVRTEAKTHWLDEIERAMAAGDFEKAQQLAAGAEAEFPGDAEIAGAVSNARGSAERAAEVEKLVSQGRALCAQQWYEEGLETLRKAASLDPRSAAARNVLVEVLSERARILLDTDWRAAEPLIHEALELDPANAIAKSLRTTAADHKRDEAVVKCFTQARQFRAAGDLESALREAEQCFAQYPLDPRLQQLCDIVKGELGKVRRAQQREGDLHAIQTLERTALASAAAGDVAVALEAAREIAGRYAGEPEFQSAVAAIETRLAEIAPPPPPPAPVEPAPEPPSLVAEPDVPAPEPPLDGLFEPVVGQAPGLRRPPGPPPEGGGGAESPAQAEGLPHEPQPEEAAVPPPPPVPRPDRTWLWGIAIGFALVVLVAGAGLALRLRTAGPPPGELVRIEIRTAPPGATIRVDGKIRGTSNFALEIPAGRYRLEALLEGHQPAAASFNAAPNVAPIELALQPLPQSVRVITDLPDGQVSLDGQPGRDLIEGQAALESVTPGAHTLKVVARGAEASVTFEVVPGRAPLLTGPPVVKGVAALAVSNLGSQTRVYSSLAPAQIEAGGQAAGEAGPDGLEVRNLAPGTHEIAAGDGKDQLRKSVEIGAAPSLSLYLQSSQNIGTLLVLANQEGADVYIDGRRYRRQTGRGGVLRIPREPRQYRIRVAKGGFHDAPEQVVQLARGEEKKVEFQLTPLPRTAQFAFTGVTAGAQVLLDGAAIGSVQPDGSFQSGSVPPGEHTVELQIGKLRSRPVRRTFVAGEVVELAAADLAVRASTGTLRVNVTPAGAQILIGRIGAAPVQAPGNTFEVEEGAYNVIARAAGFAEGHAQAQVTAGQTTTIAVTLMPAAAPPKKPAPAVAGMEGWEGSWKQDSDWYVRRGGGTVLYKQAAGPGTYAFNIMHSAGGGLLRGRDLEWVVNYVDTRNYTLFRLEKDSFRRVQVVNGRKTEGPKRPHGLDLKDQMLASVQVEVTADAVVHKLRKDGQWFVIDAWSQSGGDLTAGRFGIQIQGNDEIRISGFGFYPK